MNTATMTRAEVELALAERLWVSCPECRGSGEESDGQCHGAGRIWPLREPCLQTHSSLDGYRNWTIPGSPHTEAGCPGWVPKEMHLEDLLRLDAQREDEDLSHAISEAVYHTAYELRGTVDEILEAVERAVLAAVQ